MTYDVKDIAKWFLNRNKIDEMEGIGDGISNLKLQKLLYYAQGCALGVNDTPLFREDIVAWTHGPVVEEIYHEYKVFGSAPIAFEDDFDGSFLTKDDDALLLQVYRLFGQYSAWKLREMTHNELPWKNAAHNGIIQKESIKKYFIEKYIANAE